MLESLPPSAQRLERGEFVLLCYRLGQSMATGILSLQLDQGNSELLVVRSGQLFTPSKDGKGRDIRRRLEVLSLAGCYAHFESGLAAYPPSVGKPFSLALWAREHLEAQIDSSRARDLARELSGVRLAALAQNRPTSSELDTTDVRILEILRSPRRLDQIASLARAPRFRLLRFLHFLRSVGVIRQEGVADTAQPRFGSVARQEQARHTLGLRGLPSPADIKRAYRRLARSLHPDLNLAYGTAHRRTCEQRLAEVSSAYRELMQAR